MAFQNQCVAQSKCTACNTDGRWCPTKSWFELHSVTDVGACWLTSFFSKADLLDHILHLFSDGEKDPAVCVYGILPQAVCYTRSLSSRLPLDLQGQPIQCKDHGKFQLTSFCIVELRRWQGVGVSRRSVRFQGLCAETMLHVQDSLFVSTCALCSELCAPCESPLHTAAADAEKSDACALDHSLHLSGVCGQFRVF